MSTINDAKLVWNARRVLSYLRNWVGTEGGQYMSYVARFLGMDPGSIKKAMSVLVDSGLVRREEYVRSIMYAPTDYEQHDGKHDRPIFSHMQDGTNRTEFFFDELYLKCKTCGHELGFHAGTKQLHFATGRSVRVCCHGCKCVDFVSSAPSALDLIAASPSLRGLRLQTARSEKI